MQSVMDSKGDYICQSHDGIQARCLQKHPIDKSGDIYDSGDVCISDTKKVFSDAGTWF